MSGRLTFAVVSCALTLAASVSSGQQSRDTTKLPAPAVRTGSGTISGIVVDAAGNAEPLRRVTVMLSEQVAGSGPAVVTEADGRFSFHGLPAGRYLVTAMKPAWLTTAYGVTRPRRSGSAPTGTAIALAEGQSLTDVRLTMFRGGVITGTVRTSDGQPARGAAMSVSYLRRDANGSRTVAVIGTDTTDSRGVYRIFGLPPGEYQVAAGWAAAMNDLEVTRDADLSIATRLSRPDPAGASTPPAPPVTRPRVGGAATFYPGVRSPADASAVTVAAGEEKSGIDLRLEFGRNVRVNGRVVDEHGAPASGVTLRLGSESTTSGPFVAVAQSSLDGIFSFRGVPPGTYRVDASAGSQAGAEAALWAQTRVSTNEVDVENLQLALARGGVLTGSVHLPSGVGVPADMSRVRVVVSPPNGGNRLLTPDAAGTVRMPALPGRYRLSVQVARAAGREDLMAASATFAGADALESGFDIPPGPSVPPLVITLTNQVPEITGSLADSAGRPAPEYFVIVFPSDRALWTWGSSRIRQVRPGSDGRFVFAALPAGEYQIGAVTDVEENEWFEPAFLEQLLAASVKVRLAPGQKLVQDLRVK